MREGYSEFFDDFIACGGINKEAQFVRNLVSKTRGAFGRGRSSWATQDPRRAQMMADARAYMKANPPSAREQMAASIRNHDFNARSWRSRIGGAARSVGSGVGSAARSVGSGVSGAARSVGSGVSGAARSVGSGVGSAARSVGSGVSGAVGRFRNRMATRAQQRASAGATAGSGTATGSGSTFSGNAGENIVDVLGTSTPRSAWSRLSGGQRAGIIGGGAAGVGAVGGAGYLAGRRPSQPQQQGYKMASEGYSEFFDGFITCGMDKEGQWAKNLWNRGRNFFTTQKNRFTGSDAGKGLSSAWGSLSTGQRAGVIGGGVAGAGALAGGGYMMGSRRRSPVTVNVGPRYQKIGAEAHRDILMKTAYEQTANLFEKDAIFKRKVEKGVLSAGKAVGLAALTGGIAGAGAYMGNRRVENAIRETALARQIAAAQQQPMRGGIQ